MNMFIADLYNKKFNIPEFDCIIEKMMKDVSNLIKSDQRADKIFKEELIPLNDYAHHLLSQLTPDSKIEIILLGQNNPDFDAKILLNDSAELIQITVALHEESV